MSSVSLWRLRTPAEAGSGPGQEAGDPCTGSGTRPSPGSPLAPPLHRGLASKQMPRSNGPEEEAACRRAE